MREIDYSTVPVDYMAGAVQRYIENGLEPGSFMRALLSNDLRGAIARADGMNIARIPHWVVWMEQNMPVGSWGSPDAYWSWVDQGGGLGPDGNDPV